MKREIISTDVAINDYILKREIIYADITINDYIFTHYTNSRQSDNLIEWLDSDVRVVEQ